MFRRGDVDADGSQTVSDAVRMLSHLFRAGEVPCRKAVDVNDDGTLSITDPIVLLRYLFREEAPLPAPSFQCGLDTTPDDLDCRFGRECAP